MDRERIDVCRLLYDLCGDEAVLSPDADLKDSGLMDSMLLIELLTALEDRGVTLPLTRLDRTLLRTPAGIQRMVDGAGPTSAAQ